VHRALLATVAAVLAVLAIPAGGSSAPSALSCGVPEGKPAWIDFADGSTPFFRERFARPGVIVATGGPDVAREARVAGAGNIFWDMWLRKRIGTPLAPVDNELMEQRADVLMARATFVTGCQRPLIALNELSGARTPWPLTSTAEQYRANVLRFMKHLVERGARPALLVAGRPYTEGEAAEWWRQVGEISDVVIQRYSNANVIWRAGPVDGSRKLREFYRDSAIELLQVGIPASRLGLMIGFMTGPGVGGREGLKPRSRWFDVVKWQAFASREIAGELRLGHVWSWGWAQRNARSTDPDKTYAACVWLWARDPKLCDAPGTLGKELDADRHEGQIDLPAGARCSYGDTMLSSSRVSTLANVTGDRELALTALLVRAVENARIDVRSDRILAAEQRIVTSRFRSNRAAYRAALGEAGAGLATARGIIADELRRLEISSRLRIGRPRAADVTHFRATFGSALARQVEVSPAPSWLPDGKGLAIDTSAPQRVFRVAVGRWVRLRTAEGVFRFRALGATTPLEAVAAGEARHAILREIRSALRVEAYGSWSIRKQKEAASRLTCKRDRMPELGVVALSSFAPFLSLHEASAERDFAVR
jgi:hypothetical protein